LYFKLKESFCVEEQGIENELDDDEDPENKITRFIDLVKSMKVGFLTF
jgi:hypothetical protein